MTHNYNKKWFMYLQTDNLQKYYNLRLVYIIMLSALLIFTGSASYVCAQSPGGVSTNLQRWYKADAGITLTSGAVSGWQDQTLSAVSVSQGSAGNRPTYNSSSSLINFHPNVEFDGTNDRLTNTSGGVAFGTGAYTFYYIAANRDPSPSNWVLGMGASAALNGFNSGSSSTATTLQSGGTTFVTKTNVWADGIPTLIRTGFNGGTTQPYYQSSNGTSEVTSANVSPNISSTNFSIGARPDGTSNSWDGHIAEIIVYTGKHSATNYNKIESYLSLKYGINKSGDYVSSSGTTVWTSGGGYDNNVAGLARNDAGALYQKQSQSVNTGSQVVMSLGTIAASNTANSNTISADNRYFIWGDDNGSLTSQVSTGNSTYTYRFTRIWKTQNTNSFAESITVYYPVSAFGNALAASVSLLYGSSTASLSNGTASTITQSGTATINSVSYYKFSVPAAEVANMQYFSFTGTISYPGGVTGEILWLRADYGLTPTSGTGTITAWTDQSGVGNSISSVAVTPSRSGTLHNFNPSIEFNNDAEALVGTNLGLSGDNTWGMFNVFAPAELVNDGDIMLLHELSGAVDKIEYTTTGNTYTYSGVTSYNAPTGLIVLNKPNVLSTVSTSAGTTQQFLDGLAGSSASYTVTSSTNPYVVGDETITGMNDGLSMNFNETVVYNKLLSTTERGKIQSYLATKYGITLGNTSNQISYLASDASTTWTGSGTYQNNIAGIGRDDLTALYQKQSRSVNSNSNGQVTIGLGTIQTSNAANTGTFPEDKTFLITGDNGNTNSLAAASTNFTFNGTNTNVRMNRVWRVQNTGTDQDVTIQFPTASVGTVSSPSGSCASYVIIFSSDPTFSTGVTVNTLTVNGSNYEATKLFPEGTSYFTFGKVLQVAPGKVYLPYTNTTAIYNSTCTNNPGWKYYYYDAAKTQKAFAIYWNGNTEPAGINGVVSYSASPYSQTSGSFQCNIMGRLLEILPAGGSFTTNGGVQVRIFFDSTELINSRVPSLLSEKWFKYSGDAAATQADNNGEKINAATYLTPAAAGQEDDVDYVEFSGITSFSTFGFASNNGPQPLPLHLLDFKALKTGGDVALTWTTAQEINFSHFVVERSLDGRTAWAPIANVPAKGNTHDVNRYQLTDFKPYNEGILFYRLVMADNDGSIARSAARSVLFPKTETAPQAIIYPNPSNGSGINIDISGDMDAVKDLKIYDISGRIVMDLSKQVFEGNAQIKNIQLVTGIYLVTFETSYGIVTQKVIIN